MLQLRWVTAALAVLVSAGHAQDPAGQTSTMGAPASVTAFVGVAVIPMDTNRILRDHTVLIQNGRIIALGPASHVRVPAGAMSMAGHGKYLIPGLADMHVHIGSDEGGKSLPYDSAAAERRLLLWLAQGVTTVRNMDYQSVEEVQASRTKRTQLDPTFVLRLRARAVSDELLSPRIYTSGPWGPNQYNGVGSLGRTPTVPPLDSVAGFVAAYKAAGYDFIKIHDEESAELLDSLVTAARRVGIPVAGHAWGSGKHFPNSWAARMEPEQTVAWVAKAGLASVEHRVGFSVPLTETARLQALAEESSRIGVWHCPTLVTEPQAATFALVNALQKAGVGLLLGTDAPVFPRSRSSEPHGDPGVIHTELQALVTAGLTPYQALVTGTRNPAAFFGTLDSLGTVAVGKRADLVLLSGNPLENIANTTQPMGVMLGGRWLTREAIEDDPRLRREQRLTRYHEYGIKVIVALIAEADKAAELTVEDRKMFRRALNADTSKATRYAVIDALGNTLDMVVVQQRILESVARQFGRYRAGLSNEQRTRFDAPGRAWMREYISQGRRVVVPGLSS